MKLNRQEFIDILSTLKPALAKKDIIEQATHFVFTGKEIVTYNDKICIRYPLETTFKLSVKAEEFYKVISNIKEEEIELDFNSKELLVSSNSVKSGFVISEDEKIEELVGTIGEPSKWHKLPEDFLEGVSMCMFSASKNQTQGIFCCINIKDDVIIACDNDNGIASQYFLDDKMKESFLIPAISVAELIKLNVVEYGMKESWISFRTENKVVFSSRIEKGDYADISKFFEFEFIRFRLPDKFKELVDTSCILADGDFDVDKEIDVVIDEGKISCKGQRDEVGWIEAECDIKAKSKKVEFVINPLLLSKILYFSNVICCGENRGMFTSKKFKHLIYFVATE